MLNLYLYINKLTEEKMLCDDGYYLPFRFKCIILMMF